jgi:tetratricopeptide (TPR) repeat protein
VNRLQLLLILVALGIAAPRASAAVDALFREGTAAYRAGDYSPAARAFSQAAERQPASGTFQNLGNAEWQGGSTGRAILAWERAVWLDPFNGPARNNLRFARKTAQVEAPELAWDEVVATWLPIDWWAWITGASLWLAVAMVLLPGILRRPKAAWHQAVAALGIMVFLLSVPAHFGVHTRARIGFVVQKDAPLRLTPTREAQVLTRLGAGEPVRWVRARGPYVLVRASRALGWIQRRDFGLVCEEKGRGTRGEGRGARDEGRVKWRPALLARDPALPVHLIIGILVFPGIVCGQNWNGERLWPRPKSGTFEPEPTCPKRQSG